AADAAAARDAVGAVATEAHGRVDEVVGLVVKASVSGVALGEIVKIDRRGREPLAAEVVGFRAEHALLLPFGELGGISPTSAVWGGARPGGGGWPVDRLAPSALDRPPIREPLATGVRVIDTMLTLGRGQRIGLFSAAGVGKSTLLGQIARGTSADVIVLCLV